MIDWFLFSMARYLLTADPANDSVVTGRAWDGLLDSPEQEGSWPGHWTASGP